MTLRQDNIAKEVLTSKTLKEAGLKAGYKLDTGSRQIYRKSTKEHIAKIFQEQGVTRDSLKKAYEDCLELCRKKEDYSTLKATIDSLARLYGHLKDTQSTQVSVFTGDMIKDLPPIDIEPAKTPNNATTSNSKGYEETNHN